MKGGGDTCSKWFGKKQLSESNFNKIKLTLIYEEKRKEVKVNTSDTLHNIKIDFMKYCKIKLNEQDSYLFRKDSKYLNNNVPIINYITENANTNETNILTNETTALTTHNPLSMNTTNKGVNNSNEIILTLTKT